MEPNESFPGPWCEEFQVTESALINSWQKEKKYSRKNELVIELANFARKKK